LSSERLVGVSSTTATIIARAGVERAELEHALPADCSLAPLFDDERDPRLAPFYRAISAASQPGPTSHFDFAKGLLDAVQDLASDVVPHHLYRLKQGSATNPKDPQASEPAWSLKAIDCDAAWAIPPKDPKRYNPAGEYAPGDGILIGHPDTGYTDHFALKGAVRDDLGWDFFDNDDDETERIEDIKRAERWLNRGHGTTTGSIIVGPRGDKMSGVAPGARLVPLRIADRVWHAYDVNLARAIRHATNQGCHVISMSFGGLYFEAAEAAINLAIREGIIVLAAAGNYLKVPMWPARYPAVIAVAATNVRGEPWAGSCRGDAVFAAAPGENVWAAGFVDGTAEVIQHCGTSEATAAVAGIAALWLAHWGPERIAGAVHGTANIQNAFRSAVEIACASVRPAVAGMGVGVVNAKRVLEVPLDQLRPKALRDELYRRPPIRELYAVADDDPSYFARAGRGGGLLNTYNLPIDLTTREQAFQMMLRRQAAED